MQSKPSASPRPTRAPCEDPDRLRRLETIVRHTTNMVVVTDRDRKITWVNPAYTQITGWTLDEVRGRNPRSFLHGPRTSLVDASRIAMRLRNGLPVHDAELLNYKKSGEPYWVSLNIEPIVDDSGGVVEYVAIQSDITERKRREAESARTLRALLETQRLASLGNMEHDLASNQVRCSEEVFRILDAASEDVDTSYESLIASTHPDDLPWFREGYERAVNAGEAYETEIRVISHAGRVKWVHFRGAMEGWDDGTPAVYRIAVQDISERKRAEEVARGKVMLERVARTQMEVLASVSHELRTPLHAMLGFTDLIEAAESAHLQPDSRRMLGHVRTSARHLLALVNDMLDLVRLHEGRMVLDEGPVSLPEVVAEVAALMQPAAAERGVTLDAEPAAPALAARADRRRLVQVLINLVGNAIKYNRPSGRVVIRCAAQDGDRVSVAVQDTGIGIAARHLERLFEPFYRVAGSGPDAGPDRESSGLGLPITRRLVQAMSGRVRVESEPGAGSTFTVTLPRAADVAPAAGRAMEDPTAATRARAGSRRRAASGPRSC